MIGGQKMSDYVWPLHNSATPDDMNTSFGPRINADRWDFHDGIDLPTARKTDIHAMREGNVYHAGQGGSGGYSSRHVVIKVQDPTDGEMYNVYLHLDSIDPAVVTGGSVVQGQLIGTVGDDHATYTHLHVEFRKGTPRQIGSVHPLTYLPYTATANFRPPTADRFNRLDAFMAARLLFGTSINSPGKLEGDLIRVEVDLRRGTGVLATRVVDFNDKRTVNEDEGDRFLFVDDIGVEGYQKSPMVQHHRTDLAYGVLIRRIPRRCDNLIARVFDVGGNIVTSASVAVPYRLPVDEFVDFEDGQLLPAGWTTATSGEGSGTGVSIDPAAVYSGTQGLRCVDHSSTEASTQRAGLEHAVAAGRFEWRVQAWFNPIDLGLAPVAPDESHAVYLLYFLSGTRLSVAARIRNYGGTFRAGLVARNPDDTFVDDDGGIVETGRWRRWRLELLRVGTRETTAILYLNDRNDGGRMQEHARLDWDSTGAEPDRLRAGIGFSSKGASATILVDELWLTEAELSP
jgi:hypothetical protein